MDDVKRSKGSMVRLMLAAAGTVLAAAGLGWGGLPLAWLGGTLLLLALVPSGGKEAGHE